MAGYAQGLRNVAAALRAEADRVEAAAAAAEAAENTVTRSWTVIANCLESAGDSEANSEKWIRRIVSAAGHIAGHIAAAGSDGMSVAKFNNYCRYSIAVHDTVWYACALHNIKIEEYTYNVALIALVGALVEAYGVQIRGDKAAICQAD